jgi:lipopolysaccharide export system protein LptA
MSKRCFRNSVLLVLSLFLAGAAAEGAGPAEGKREPIVITSDSMKAAELDDTVEFVGNVTLKKEGMTLYSDKVTVFYDTRTKGIREIEAQGNVVVRKEGRVAHAGRAQYYSSDEKIVLTGEARILENENEIGGDRITLFMRDDRSVVEGGKVLFYQDAAEGKRQKAEDKKQKTETRSQKPEAGSGEQD